MKPFCGVIFLLIIYSAAAQGDLTNKYGLQLVQNEAAYTKSIINKPGFAMADLKKAVPQIEFDLRYATSNNFLHKAIYPPLSTAFLRYKAVTGLIAVQNELKAKGLGLKIFDAYRPYTVTEKIWKLVNDERYAASPEKGSNHNRGVAVDLTVIDLKTKAALEMGTDFDSFSDSAHHNFTALPGEVLQNRQLLKSTMEKYGFESFDTEWWHYTLPNAKQYELMNLSFKQLKKLTADH